MERQKKRLAVEKELTAIQDELFTYAMSLTHDINDAADLLQDTWLKALMNDEKYSDHGKFIAWARTIMKHTFLNNERHKQYHNKLFIEGTEGFDSFNNMAADGAAPLPDCKIMHKEIMAIIAKLPQSQSFPLQLRLSGFSYKEIAERTVLSIGGVKSSLHYARENLKKILKNN